MLGFFRGGDRGVNAFMENLSLSLDKDNQESAVNGAQSSAHELSLSAAESVKFSRAL